MTFSVADLTRGMPDGTGVIVQQIYIKIDGLYAVYRTEERVVIQYADDPDKGADQRKSLSEIYMNRGVVDSLLDEVCDTQDPKCEARVLRYQRRLADALTLALQGQSNLAATELETLKQTLLEERKSRARQSYLMASSAVAASIVLLIALLSSPLLNFGISGDHSAVASSMWFAGAVGTIGAFFSTILAVRNREIEPSISIRDTATDAALRLFVGAISGTLLYVLIKSKAFELTIGGAKINGDDAFASGGTGWLLVLLVAFVAGFLERLVPDMLAKVAATETKDSKPSMSAKSAAEDAASSETDPLGKKQAAGAAAPGAAAPGAAAAAAAAAPEPDDPERDEDDCCDRPGTPELLTEDVELPEAVGGVEEAPRQS